MININAFPPKGDTHLGQVGSLEGATILSIMTSNIIPLSMIGLFATLSINDTQQNDTQY